MLRTYYGPPGWGEHPDTDSREHQVLLRLASPICVEALPENYDDAESNVRRITLVANAEVSLRPFAGKNVEVVGTLFHAGTMHHHTLVLMTVGHVEAAGGQ